MDNNTKIDALYEEMLKTADSMAQDGITKKSVESFKNIEASVNQLTLEGFEENKPKMLDEVSTVTTSASNCEDQLTIEMPKPDPDQPAYINHNGEKVMVSYDPSNGEQKVLENTEELAMKIAGQHLNNLNNFDSKAVTSDIIKEVIASKELTGEANDEATQLSAMIARRMAGENFNAYEEGPKGFKEQVDKVYMDLLFAGNLGKGGRGNLAMNKRVIARMMLDDMISEFKKDSATQLDIDTILSSFDEDVKKMKEEMSTELGGMMMSFDEERKLEIDAAIKRCTEDGKTEAVENLQKIRNNLDRAYDLTDFITFCRTCKIKNYEVKEPKRVFDYFNNKYVNHKLVINDIRCCPDILDRHLTEYTHDQNMILCMAFCKYCLNMHPDRMEDHTFMYYFIRNIIAIDRLNPKGNIYESMDERSKKFYDGFVTSLRLALENVLERNPNFK